jgi:polyisoprenoid-binding protein YceI
MRSFLLALALAFSCSAFAQTIWHQQSYDISFHIKHTGMGVNGSFGNLKATLVFSPDNLSASSLKGTVDVSTINTGIGARNNSLKKESYFDADKYKTIEVVSKKIYTKGTAYAGMFDVTIKGVTKEVEIPFEFIQLGDEAEFKGSFPLNRRDFNVGGASMLMADKLEVNIDIKVKK